MLDHCRITSLTEDRIPEMMKLVSAFLEEQVAIDSAIKTVPDWKPHMEKFLREAIARDNYHVRVMLADGNIIGFVMCGTLVEPTYEKGHIGYVADCYVIPELRQQGMGRHLVEDSMEILTRAGVDTVQLNVLSRNEAGVKFWERLGFLTYMYRMRKEIKKKKDDKKSE